jgi:hypothetical protein
METVSKEVVQEQQPFDVAWKTIDGLKIRYATNGRGGERIVLFSPWPESIFAFAPVWAGLSKQFEVLRANRPTSLDAYRSQTYSCGERPRPAQEDPADRDKRDSHEHNGRKP